MTVPRLAAAWLAAAVAFTTAAGLVPAASGSSPASVTASSKPDGKPAAPQGEKDVLGDPGLADVIKRVAARRTVERSEATVRGDKVRVEVLGGAGLAHAVKARGGAVVDRAPGLVLADVPATAVRGLLTASGVGTVRLPLDYSVVPQEASPALSTLTSSDPLAQVGAKGADAVTKVGIAPWHAAGRTGRGIKVGIIDTFSGNAWNAAAASGDLPAGPSGSFCRREGVGCADTFWNGDPHGVGVAEIVRDMAPDAQLYLASVSTITDYRAAIDYFASQGVRIVSRSLAAAYDGPGDGGGPFNTQVVNYAVGKGMAWFNSAGNSAGATGRLGGYYRTSWTDTDGDGWLNYADGSELLGFWCNPEGFYFLGLRWSDWGVTRTDYDLYIYDEAADETPYAEFERDQLAADVTPVEAAGWWTSGCAAEDWDYIAVRLDPRVTTTTGGDVLEMMINGSFLDNWNNPHSATQAASDSANPGAASVGAVDPVGGTTIAPYSSWGPSNDGRIKPDLSAPSKMTSVSYPSGFGGTSAATPVVSGAAAVVLAHEPTLTPAQLVARMKTYVVDRGEAGPDNLYGVGELLMPSLAPPVQPVTPVAPPVTPAITSAGLRPVMTRLAKALPVELTWRTITPQLTASVTRSVNRGRAEIAAYVIGGSTSARATLELGKANQLAISYTDGAGVKSPEHTLASVVPVAYDDRDRVVKFGRGWRRLRVGEAWKRTLTGTNRASSLARMTFTGSAVSLVMTRSGISGAARVFLDGKDMGRVNLRTKGAKHRQVVMNLVAASRGRHTIEIEPLTRGQKGWVHVDGLVVLR